MPREILILKLGALGDVLRTTPLLRRLEGRVTWVAEREAFPLLAGNPRIARLIPIESPGEVRARAYDLVVGFDEDERACRLAGSVRARRVVGLRLRGGERSYCADSAPWFDRSLVSRLGRAAADRLKASGRRCYQDYLFRACGLEFRGEEYMLPLRPAPAPARRAVLEPRAGATWPAKAWPGYPARAERLRAGGFDVSVLRRRARLADYAADVGRAGLLVCGDTLALHLGLALRRRVVALFTCTSPHEIHGYGRLTKVVDERLAERFYSRRAARRALAGLPVERVLRAARRAAASGDVVS
ncbi:MAG: hypothetical protein KGM24_10815 [Elusimicrobia bacterium]|nr:hypothetical protein [Elusimicrobiota bacterium]